MGFLSALMSVFINVVRTSGKPVPSGYDGGVDSKANSASLWHEIEDYPDGRAVPGFLQKMDAAEFGLKPKSFSNCKCD